MSDTAIVTIERFLGINDNPSVSCTAPGEARYMSNFVITADGRLRKRRGKSPVSANAVSGKVLQVIDFPTATLMNYSYLVLTETALWGFRFQTGSFVRLYDRLSPGRGRCFVKDGKLWLIGGEFTAFNTDMTVAEIVPYVPTLCVGRSPSGTVYTPFEKPNRLTGSVCEAFTSDGSAAYRLSYVGAANVTVVSEAPVPAWSISAAGNTLTFATPIAAGYTVKVTYTAPELSNAAADITSCRDCMFYGGAGDVELFVWSGSDNIRYYSQGGNISYFPSDNSDRVGENGIIYGMARQYDRQLVFSSSGIWCCEASLSESGDVSFPLSILNDACRYAPCGAAVADNAPVFLGERGLYRVTSTAVRSEKNIESIGERVSELLACHSFFSMYDCEARSELIMTGDGIVLVWNYRTDVFYTLHGLDAAFFFEQNGELFFFNTEGYVFGFNGSDTDFSVSGEKSPVEACCYLEGFDFGTPFRRKKLRDIFVRLGKSPSAGATAAAIGDGEGGGEASVLEGGYTDFADFSFPALVFGGNYACVCRISPRGERFSTLDIMLRSCREGESTEIATLTVTADRLYTVARQ